VDYIGASGKPISYNLFAYCENNPVNNSDESGFVSVTTLKKESWMFRVASYFGVDVSHAFKKTQQKYFVKINGKLLVFKISISVGQTNNYKAGMSFGLSVNGLSISNSTSFGKNYSIAHAFNLNWKGVSRSMSLTYMSKKYGIFVSFNVEFYCSHLVTAGVVAACCYYPALIPAVKNMYLSTKSSSVKSMTMIATVMRRCYA
jgi:hypothetical protein